jgi:hypothetical protein
LDVSEHETWRSFALYLLLFGTGGVGLELVLLGHYEDPWQWAPLVLLAAGAALGAVLAVRPGRRLVRSFRALMVAYLLAGGLGLYLHLNANVEFERELRPSIGGTQLIVETLKGAIPALAPGAMAQLGLLGLLICYRHPTIHPKERDA